MVALKTKLHNFDFVLIFVGITHWLQVPSIQARMATSFAKVSDEDFGVEVVSTDTSSARLMFCSILKKELFALSCNRGPAGGVRSQYRIVASHHYHLSPFKLDFPGHHTLWCLLCIFGS